MNMDTSFKILINEHYEMLFCYIYSLCSDRTMAEDIVQEAFLIAYKKLSTFDPKQDFGAWIRGIGRHLTMAQQRKSKRLIMIDPTLIQDRLEENFRGKESPGSQRWTDMLEALKKCLGKIEKGTKKIIDMYYTNRLQAQTIASRLRLSVDNVWKKLSRGRKSLKNCVEKQLN